LYDAIVERGPSCAWATVMRAWIWGAWAPKGSRPQKSPFASYALKEK
jgi:hypothetical protein